jgi:hypothetical protein
VAAVHARHPHHAQFDSHAVVEDGSRTRASCRRRGAR